ncbi:MAG: DUF5317 family protein [Sedimentibacter sp.]|uniref:DUF5317 family protein n=1 Tax=Sedimentibacter sp. TaxID=1960295 RepID=UPI0029823E23|nr:DUF5317 family protein [Sedimentibacter sp.]MDW5299483.1 DUF5317 family protein [Sedimentibacter sp.]
MFFEALILGMIIGYARRGRISRLAYVHFNAQPLIYVSAVLYLGIIVMNLGLYDYSSFLYAGFLLISFILTLLFLIANISMKFMFVPLIGLFLNLLVFLVNGFKFPLDAAAAAKIYGTEIYELLNNGKIIFFTSAENASLSFLGNIITVGNLFIVSIGDIIAAMGIALVIQAIISDKFIQSRNRITFSKNIFK